MLRVHIRVYEVYFFRNYLCEAAALVSEMTKTDVQLSAVWRFLFI